MHYHSQNLTDGRLPIVCHGRAWLRSKNHHSKPYSREFHWEWGIGKFAHNFAIKVYFGNGDDDAGVLFHICIPWIISLFFGVSGVFRCKECCTGIAIHDQSIWFYVLPYTMDSSRDFPWYRQTRCIRFPWSLEHYNTQVLGHVPLGPDMPVEWQEREGKNKKRFMDTWEARQVATNRVSRNYPYSYILKNQKVQKVTATVSVSRMEWRARWWPLIPIRKVSTSIEVKFSGEVGDRAGSWKGGCIGCGYEMKWGETPEQTLRRMEHERTFR